MMRSVVRVVAVLSVALIALSSCSLLMDDIPDSPGFHTTPCRDDFSFLAKKVDCGWMVVEETRGSANGRLVSMPVVIVHALHHPKGDPVLALHGGPGSSVVASLAEDLKAREVPITEDRDWIFFDQRGTGLSVPSLDCGTLELSDAGITSEDGVGDLLACGRALSDNGIDLSQFNSAVIAQDVAELRRALGIARYNIYGVSYGTRVASAVMQHDPTDLRAVVMDSPWSPEANWTAALPALVSSELRQVLALCAADSDCAARHPLLEQRMDAMLSQWVTAGPRKNGHRYSAEEFASYLLESLYDDEGTRSLPLHIEQMLSGDLTSLDDFLVEQSDYNEGLFFSVLCKEEFPFESVAEVDAGDGSDPVMQATARSARRFFAVCEGFDVGAPDPQENQPVVSDIPTLLISAEIDAGCPPEVAVEAGRLLSHSQVFSMPNMTHAPAQRSPCAKRMVAAFLDNPDAPVNGGCIARDRPRFPFLYPDD